MKEEWEKTNWVDILVGKNPRARILTLGEAKKILGDSDDYYVYVLWKKYTKNPVPFYVGKGHWQRIIKHGMPSDEKSNRHKSNVIKKHKRLGLEIGYSICSFHGNEKNAYQEEQVLISLIGRADRNAGPLTNKSDGGDGSLGHLAPKGGDSASARPVIAEDIRYPSVEDAAIALDITAGAVTNRIKSGWEGYYFEDEGQRPQTKPVLGRYRRPAVVEWKKFDSAADAARELDMDVRMISKRIYYGWPGYYYIDQGQLPRKTVWGGRADKVGVVIRGVSYDTIAEAERKTGEKAAKIRKRCLSSNYPEYSRKDGKVIQRTVRKKFQEAVKVGTKMFKSETAVAKHFKISRGTVDWRCRSESCPDWKFVDQEKQKQKSFVPHFSSKPVPVTIDGKYYASQLSAADANDVDIATLKQRCKSFSFPTWQCESIPKIASRDGRPGLIKIEIAGTEYRSVNQASKILKISRPTIKRRLKSDEWPEYKILNR